MHDEYAVARGRDRVSIVGPLGVNHDGFARDRDRFEGAPSGKFERDISEPGPAQRRFRRRGLHPRENPIGEQAGGGHNQNSESNNKRG